MGEQRRLCSYSTMAVRVSDIHLTKVRFLVAVPYKGNTLERFAKRLECGQVGLMPNDQEMNKVTHRVMPIKVSALAFEVRYIPCKGISHI